MSEGTVRWLPALFKGQTVHVACDPEGGLLLDGGRVPMKYRLSDERIYLAGVANVTDPQGAAFPRSSQPAPPRPAAKSSAERSARRGARDQHHHEAPRGDEVRIYTDGACSGNPGAAALGVVIEDGADTREISEYLTDQGTNNLAELTAILRGLENTQDLERQTVVYTDSQYAIGVLLKGWKPKVHLPLIARIKERIRQFKRLEIRYVPGHAGIDGNERADALARGAILQARRGG